MKILGIETSCDETAASVVGGRGDKVKVLSNLVSSQVEIHKKYGGVVPEVAAREHVLNILPVVNEALKKAGIKTSPKPSLSRRGKNEFLPLSEGENKRGCDKESKKTTSNPSLLRRGAEKVPPLNKKGSEEVLSKDEVPPSNKGRLGEVDAIAVTQGPGLITSLMTGVETAKSLAFAWGVPLIGVNHIEGHIYANFIGPISNFQFPISDIFPSIILTVSGGHTMIILMKDHGKYELIGDTRDDAAGEAFDKAAQLLEIGYPGGPVISQYAQKFKSEPEIEFPRPMIRESNFDFSFSGLKTSILYKIEKDSNWKKKISEYCYAFQEAVVDVLVSKTLKAAREYSVSNIMIAGGVSANRELRQQLQDRADKENFKVFIPDLEYTTDNAAMVAAAGYFRARDKDFIDWRKIKVNPNLEL